MSILKKELEKAGAKVLSNQSGYCVLSNTLNSEQMAEFAKDRNMNFSYSNIMFL